MVQDKDGRLLVQRAIGTFIIFLGILLGPLEVTAQQQSHFTDFRMAPSQLNPGLTGAFKGTYKINGLYRGQWGGFGDSQGLRTIVGSVELNVKGNLLLENDWISAGFNIYQDEAGTSRRKFNSTGFSIGYHLGLDKDYKNVISAGFSYNNLSSRIGQFTLRGDLGSIQPNYLDGIDIPPTPCNLPGCEGQSENQPGANDISIGFTYKTEIDENPLRLGISMLHLNQPEATVAVARGGGADSLGGGVANPNPNPQGRNIDQFRRVLAFHAETSMLMSPRVRLNPAALFMTSGGTTEFQVQSTLDYLVNPKEQISVIGGLGIRPLPSFDAAYLMAGLAIKDLTVRLSYDLTLSALRELGGGNGFELSVGYIGKIYRDPKVDKVIFCPRL